MSKLEQILDECLAQIESGAATPEECLARYPEHAAELRPLLALTSRLEQGRLVQPSPTFKMRTRAQVLAYSRSRPRPLTVAKSGLALWPRGFGAAFGRTFNFAFGAAAVLFLVLGTVTVLAQTALPGDALYRWKVGSERAWRAVHRDPLYTDLFLAARRVGELTQVVGDTQAEQVARQEYQQSLDTLATEYTAPDSQAVISDALNEQKNDLAQAGVSVPELDRLLTKINLQEANLQLGNQVTAVDNGFITYTLAVTNIGPARLVTATLLSRLSPGEKLVSASNATCTSSPFGTVTCTVDSLAADTSRKLNLTTAVDPCFAGVMTQTTTVTGTGIMVNSGPNREAVATITAPFPRSARLAFVQSNGQTHDLSLESSSNEILNAGLHKWAAAPAWSPDGTKLAFFGEGGISELGGVYSRGSGVWVVDLTSTQARNPRQLVALDHIRSIAWSPDGTKLAFEVGPPGLPHEIRVIKSGDGQEISRFPGEQPTWTPDSGQLVIKSCAPNCGLWRVNLNGSQGRRLTSGASDSFPAWSPTGEYLAFSSQRDGDWEIYLLHAADGEIQRLTQRRGTDTTPVFGPCGQDLYLRTDVYGGWWITVMKLDGSDERKIQEGVGPSDDWGMARPAVY